jgi:hypothetical protein
MTIASENARNDYTGNGSVDTYAYSFQIYDETELIVVTEEDGTQVTLTLNVDYTVTGVGATAGGNVVLTDDLGSGVLLGIIRDPDYLQGIDLRRSATLIPPTLERGYDRLTMQTLALSEKVSRCLTLPLAVAGTTAATVIPSVADRASKALGFDSNGDIAVGYGGDFVTSTGAAGEVQFSDGASGFDSDYSFVFDAGTGELTVSSISVASDPTLAIKAINSGGGDTGIWFDDGIYAGPNFRCDGVEVFWAAPDQIVCEQPLYAANGTENDPSVSFYNDKHTGFRRASANNIGVSAGGVEIAQWAQTQLSLYSRSLNIWGTGIANQETSISAINDQTNRYASVGAVATGSGSEISMSSWGSATTETWAGYSMQRACSMIAEQSGNLTRVVLGHAENLAAVPIHIICGRTSGSPNTQVEVARFTGRTIGTDQFKVLYTTSSTSSVTGAVTIAGGLGVAGSLYVGGTLVPAALTVNDNVFTVQDDADTTKKFQFQASGIATATTRTLTVPDADTTLAGLSVAQSFTANQTFTANISQTGSGTVSTGTGAHTFNGTSTFNADVSAVAGYRMSVNGGISSVSMLSISSGASPLTSATQSGVRITYAGTVNATTRISGITVEPTTAAASFTCTDLISVATNQALLAAGAGSTVTRFAAFATRTQTIGGTFSAAWWHGAGTTLSGSGTWCIYNVTADANYLGTGATLINTTTDNATDKLQVFGSGIFTAASTQDAIRIQGRAGGSSSRIATITVAALTGSVTHTLPDITGTFGMLEGTQTFSGAKTFTGGVTVTTADVTVTDRNIILSATTGTKFGTATTQKLSFFNSTPVVQPTAPAAASAAVATTGSTSTTPFGYTTAAQADDIITQLNKATARLNDIYTRLQTLGLMA